jgi:hypothetical protein
VRRAGLLLTKDVRLPLRGIDKVFRCRSAVKNLVCNFAPLRFLPYREIGEFVWQARDGPAREGQMKSAIS